jgi:hypothetical protein
VARSLATSIELETLQIEKPAICGIFLRGALDKFAPIFRLALMGADEKAEAPAEGVISAFAAEVEQKLNDGWRVSMTTDGQLLLIPPSRYDDAA